MAFIRESGSTDHMEHFTSLQMGLGTQNLPATATGTAIAGKAQTPILFSAKDPYQPAINLLTRVLLSIPQCPYSGDRMTIALELFAEAMDGHPITLCREVIEEFKFHNPRAPFCFGPQDLYEALKSRRWRWEKAIISHFLEKHSEWSNLVGGPVPFEPGCKVPDVMIHETMRWALQKCPGTHWHHVKNMPDTRFAKLRKEWFQAEPDPGDEERPPSDNTHAGAVAERAKIKADREFDAYLANLDPGLREARRHVLFVTKAQGEKLTEDELIARAKERRAEEIARLTGASQSATHADLEG